MNNVYHPSHGGQAPKRSNSGREIVYIQQNRLVGSGHPVQDTYISHQPAQVAVSPIPADVAEVFDGVFRKYSFRDLYKWLKFDRQAEISHMPSGLSNGHDQMSRPSMASSRASRTSSLFSMPAGYHRDSFASSRTSYSHMSDLSEADSMLSPNQMMGAVTLNPSSASIMSRASTASRSSAVSNNKHSSKQRENDLEVKKRYFCTACNKGFARKYDWKVHEQRYHEQQFQYPCPDCNQILYAETHFRSHHRDAHGCQQCTHAKEVTKEVDARRRRTAWGCGFCGELLDDWEKRCDHISQHYDDGQKRVEWDHSKVIIGLLRQPGIDEAWQSMLIAKHGHHPNPPLQVRFSKETTARSHGDALQLQDLLELGAIDRDIDQIVQLAYDHGVRNAPPPSQEGSSSLDAVKEEQEITVDSHDAHDTNTQTPSTGTDNPQDSVMGSPNAPDQQPQQTSTVPVMFSASPMDLTSQHQFTQSEQSRSPMTMDPSMSQMFNFGGFTFQDYNAMNQQPSYDKELPPIPVDNDAKLLQQQQQHHSHVQNHGAYDQWTMLTGENFAVDHQGLDLNQYHPHGHY